MERTRTIRYVKVFIIFILAGVILAPMFKEKKLNYDVRQAITSLNLTDADKYCSEKLKSGLKTALPETEFFYTEKGSDCEVSYNQMSFMTLISHNFLVTVNNGKTEVTYSNWKD